MEYFKITIGVEPGNDMKAATFIVAAPNLDMARQAATKAMAQLGFGGDQIQIAEAKAIKPKGAAAKRILAR